ncbi:hypothetical protein AWM61_05560 [Riemerella anatipestifer]|nr:hypothetical protein Riean_1596 [Riemerella anatipestifer ATCC 11845 = DSM 15868]AKQ40349.1 hypothetical protein AS87_08535 [Riemerella anatipestifer Yb2]EFT35549.1 hypothetical protein RAYM_04956 [Riemerella anatipestifer RA-YM]MDD1598182.1 hypothetical protein [Riemerella anatipestifer]MRM92410.1 hypothetical protein [Riemerella anatipestifer]
MKNSMFKIFIISLVILSFFAYLIGLTDSAFQKNYYSDNIFICFINSIKYFIFWVLPYWWLIILIGAILSMGIFYVFKRVIYLMQK